MSHVFYVTGVRGVGKTAFVKQAHARLSQKGIKTLLLPEWTEPPRPGISYLDFAKWLMQQRIQRDILLRNATEGEFILCDRSPICPLVFALANLEEEELLELPKEYRSHSFVEGTYLHLTAELETIYQRLVNRGDTLWCGTPEQVIPKIENTAIAYEAMFREEDIQPVVFVTDNVKVSVIVDRFEQHIARLITNYPRDVQIGWSTRPRSEVVHIWRN